MGLCKVVAKRDGKVVFVHQLGQDGLPYAEPGVPSSRVDWTAQDGQVGTISWSFTPYGTPPEGMLWPEAAINPEP